MRTFHSDATRWDHLLGALLCVAYVWVLFVSAADMAMSRDESFYMHAGEEYGRWIEIAFDNPGKAFEQKTIDRYWKYNNEHPPLMKTLFAVSWLAQKHWQVFPRDNLAFRFPGMLTGGLLIWLTYIFGVRTFGRQAGLFAAVALATMPRVFYHSQLNCFDVPVALMATWVTYCYWRSYEKPIWLFWTGVSYGLALATKHNAWIIPGIFLIHFLWMHLRARAAGAGAPRPSRIPWWFVSMVVIGVPLFWSTWPWLWTETITRFQRYAAFHIHHVHYSMEYFGVNYFAPPMPISFPWVMTLFTVSATVLVMCVVGLALRVRTMLPPFLTVARSSGSPAADARATDVLLVGALLAPLVVISLPSTPIFGGTKHWFPSYPFVALFAGYVFALIAQAIRRANLRGPGWVDAGATASLFVLLVVPGAIETHHSRGFGLSHYTAAAGGVPGAADKGMNRQFWGFTHGELADWFAENLPNGGRVFLCDATPWSWEIMQRDGLIPKNIQGTYDLGVADAAIVHHELHFSEVDYQIWQAFGTTSPATVLTHDGVPIVSVYLKK